MSLDGWWIFVILASAFFVAVGITIGRIWALLLPPAAWGLFYLSLQQGWWGAGVGDGWQYAMAFIILVSLAATAVGFGVGFAIRRNLNGKEETK